MEKTPRTVVITVIVVVCVILQLIMASIRDYNVVEQFNSRLEEIRTKLLHQAMGEALNDTAAELCQEHRQYMKSVLGETLAGLFCGCH